MSFVVQNNEIFGKVEWNWCQREPYKIIYNRTTNIFVLYNYINIHFNPVPLISFSYNFIMGNSAAFMHDDKMLRKRQWTRSSKINALHDRLMKHPPMVSITLYLQTYSHVHIAISNTPPLLRDGRVLIRHHIVPHISIIQTKSGCPFTFSICVLCLLIQLVCLKKNSIARSSAYTSIYFQYCGDQ